MVGRAASWLRSKGRARARRRAELRREPPGDSLVEREGEAVRRRSDLVLRLHVVHLLGVRVVDGHHPVAHTHAGLGGLTARGQLDREHRAGNRRRLGLRVCGDQRSEEGGWRDERRDQSLNLELEARKEGFLY